MKTLVFSKDLHGLKACSEGGSILGHVDEIYFDDRSWNVRYLVLDVGHWMKNRKVLVAPVAFRGVDWQNGRILIDLTREQIERSPDASTDLPVARALELQIHRHYGWGMAWPESFIGSKDEPAAVEGKTYDPHLRSTKILTGTTLVGDGGETFGTITDFVIDPDAWRIEFVAAECDRIHTVLLDPSAVHGIDVERRQIRVGQTAA